MLKLLLFTSGRTRTQRRDAATDEARERLERKIANLARLGGRIQDDNRGQTAGLLFVFRRK